LVPGELVGAGIDWLTVTVGELGAGALLAQSRLEEAGVAMRGFGRSESRATMGGHAWRRWEPHQPSKRWGLGYESWEWSGSDARWPASFLRSLEAQPSRVDVAFDLAVEDSVRSETVIDADLQRWIESEHGMKVGAMTDDGVDVTRYVGARAADRRLRVYRKDLKDQAWLIEHGPVLRVELVLRGAWSQAWWSVWKEQELRGIEAAAAIVEEITGRRVMAAAEPVPRPLADPGVDLDAAQYVLEFVKQHASALDAIAAMGVDLFGIAGLVRERWCRQMSWRHQCRLDRFKGADPGAIEDAVIRMLGSRTDAALHNSQCK
jgi:hypothetical protein